MRSVTYEEIEGLITKAEQQQTMMTCTFRCTVSGQSADSAAAIQGGANSGGMMVHAKNAARRSMWTSVRRMLFDVISKFLGRGTAGRMAREVSSSMLSGAQQMSRNIFTEEQKRDAIVRSFVQVQSRFRYDEGMGQWVWAS